MNKDRKSTVKKGAFAAIVLAVLVAVIGGTYSRYVSTANGSGDVNIAKWKVAVNDTDITTAVGTFDLSFTANNADTVPNKVAPGGEAVAYIDVDLSGTEVSVEVACALASDSAAKLTEVFGADYADKVTVAVGTPVLKENATNMTLDEATKVIKVGNAAMSGTVRVPITLKWTDDEANNAADTNTGALQNGVTIPVSLTIQQHIASN